MIDWSTYDTSSLWTGVSPGPRAALPRVEAEEAFRTLMAARPDRRQQLRRLCTANGLALESSDAGVQALNDWFVASVEVADNTPGRLASPWYAVCRDVGLFLGDALIERHPHLHWGFYIGKPNEPSHQCHVVMGFANAAPGYQIDLDRMVVTYAHAVVLSEAARPDRFVFQLQASGRLA